MKSSLFVPWDLNLVIFSRGSSVLLFLDLQIKGIKLLGFKDRSELRFEENVKHSQFIYPDELVSFDRRLLYSY
jgi:hypothetical protein